MSMGNCTDWDLADRRVCAVGKSSLSLQILPVLEDRDRMFGLIDQVIEAIDSRGLNYDVGPTDTTVEGSMDELLQLIKEAHGICHREGVENVISIARFISVRNGDVVSIEEKVSPYREA